MNFDELGRRFWQPDAQGGPRPTPAATSPASGTDEAKYPAPACPFTEAGWQIPVYHLMVEEAGIAAAFAV